MFILIVRNESNEGAIEASFNLSGYFASIGIDFGYLNSSEMFKHNDELIDSAIADKEIDMAVVLGGDGTILQTARVLQERDCPILGINFGHLGFLANDSDSGVIKLVSDALAGELREERRATLAIEVVCDEGATSKDEALERSICEFRALSESDMDEERIEAICRNAKSRLGSIPGVDLGGLFGKREFFALNEISIERGENGRMLDFSFEISDIKMAEIRGNGVIVSTATGSSGYALGAGGPLITPACDGLLVQPIAPHTLVSRAILANSNDIVHVAINKDEQDRGATLFADGSMLVFDRPVIDVYVKRSRHFTRLLYSDANHFYKYASEKFFKA